MQVDVLPLERFNAVWRPNEPERLSPVYVERVTIREALKGDLLPSLFGIVQLIEPTFGVSPHRYFAVCRITICKLVSLSFQALKGDLLPLLFGIVHLIEPIFGVSHASPPCLPSVASGSSSLSQPFSSIMHVHRSCISYLHWRGA